MITPDQADLLPEGSRTHFSKAELKEKNYRGHKWPLDFKTELQALAMPDRLRLMREALEEDVDLGQLEADRRVEKEEYKEVETRLATLLDTPKVDTQVDTQVDANDEYAYLDDTASLVALNTNVVIDQEISKVENKVGGRANPVQRQRFITEIRKRVAKRLLE
jgi:hypothetical protein